MAKKTYSINGADYLADQAILMLTANASHNLISAIQLATIYAESNDETAQINAQMWFKKAYELAIENKKYNVAIKISQLLADIEAPVEPPPYTTPITPLWKQFYGPNQIKIVQKSFYSGLVSMSKQKP